MTTKNMNNTHDTTTYSREQLELIADLCTTYGIEPDQIVFFPNDPEPIFDRPATAKILRALQPVAGIEDDIVPAHASDAVAAKWKVTFKDQTFASSTGVCNLNETIGGKTMTLDQVRSTAIGRAARSALTNGGINLLKLHNARKSPSVAPYDFTGSATAGVEVDVTGLRPGDPVKSERSRLLATVHMLGIDCDLINVITDPTEGKVTDKTEWYRSIDERYGVKSCYDLTNDQLKDFASFLRSQQPARAA